jgi:hypothetical protein
MKRMACLIPFSGFTLTDHTQCVGGSSQSGTATATDGSGFTLSANTANLAATTVTSRSGTVYSPPLQSTSGSGTVTDSNGNRVSTSFDGTATTTFTDTLGQSALIIQAPTPSPSAPTTYTYTNPSGGSSSVQVNYTNHLVRTNFGCSCVSDYGTNGTTTANLVSSVALPDGTSYTFTYETTPDYPGYRTGRIASVTLPTGGTISYSYTGSNNGIICSDGSAAGLDRTTPDSTAAWQYTRTQGSGAAWTTNVTDPQGNVSVLSVGSGYPDPVRRRTHGGVVREHVGERNSPPRLVDDGDGEMNVEARKIDRVERTSTDTGKWRHACGDLGRAPRSHTRLS